jgi:photosystem II stability/assembly factor-like uncharacterized protein
MALVACNRSSAPTGGGSPTSARSSTPASSPSPTASASAVPQLAPVPAGFGVLSTSWVSERVGWALGVVPCSGGRCVSVVQTGDGGATWVPIPAPPVPPASATDALAAQRIRFANLSDGWVFGPGLWSTHDGGNHWARVSLPGASGAQVSSLEAASGRVHAALLDGPKLRIESSPVGSEAWQPSPTELSVGAGPVPAAQLVLQGDTGWLVEVNRVVVGGARLQGGRWTVWDPPCLDAGGPAVLASSAPADLVAVCNEGLWTGPEVAIHAYESSDGGTTFRRLEATLPKGSDGDVARADTHMIAVAGTTDAGVPTITATFDEGRSWRVVYRGRSRRVIRELGFTSVMQGVGVETASDGLGGRVLMTHDGGRTWAPLRLGS